MILMKNRKEDISRKIVQSRRSKVESRFENFIRF